MRRVFRTERGQGLVEYALILVLVALVVVIMLATTGNSMHNLYSDITKTLNQQAGF